jgi:hypothetical protein
MHPSKIAWARASGRCRDFRCGFIKDVKSAIKSFRRCRENAGTAHKGLNAISKADAAMSRWVGLNERRSCLALSRLSARRVEREFNPSRKDAHWGRRKLARDW